LLDEMYPPELGERLRLDGIDAATVAEVGLSGRPDAEIFAHAVQIHHTLLTENVSDFARIAAEHLSAGGHHPGVLIALTTRFSRRPAGIPPLAAAIRAIAREELDDRLLYLKPADSD
jgi:predicted nuclease of predicted toxin-antitoxin system